MTAKASWTIPVAVAALLAASVPALAGAPGLEDLKALAGDWARVGADGEPEREVTSSWRVTAAGTAVVETLFPGGDHEMVTVYHRDGDALKLTHYCAGGNQPSMRQVATEGPGRLEFDHDGATGVGSEGENHMHHATIEWIGENRIRTTWTSHENGQANYVAQFDLVRVR